MPNARTNWIGRITRIRRKVKLIASPKAASFTIVSSALHVQLPLLVAQGEPEALDHRPDEEEAEVDDGGKDQPVGQTLPPPSRRAGAVSWAIVVIARSEHAIVRDPAPRFPARRIGRPAGGVRLHEEDLVEELALLPQDGQDVLAVADDPRERVAVDLVEVASSAPIPIGSNAWTASFACCCLRTASASASRPGEICFDSLPPTTGKKPSARGSAPVDRSSSGGGSACCARGVGRVLGDPHPDEDRHVRPGLRALGGTANEVVGAGRAPSSTAT